MSSALHGLLLFSALWTLSLCGTRQFHVVKEGKNWTEAQKYCREKFTDLATIENHEEMDAVKAALNGTTGHFWIGLRENTSVRSCEHLLETSRNNSTRCWIWSDGSNFSYTDWITGEPNNPVAENCVELWSENELKWNDAGCNHTVNFVCHKKIPLIVIKQNKTWREALKYCQEHHVDLVSVHTEDIQHQVENVTKNATTANVWVGLLHTCALKFWFWVSGQLLCYQNWAPGNGTKEEDCSGGIRTGAIQSESNLWVSLPENQTLNFICRTV